MPTISSNCLSLSSSRSSFPSPQPRSSTRLAPLPGAPPGPPRAAARSGSAASPARSSACSAGGSSSFGLERLLLRDEPGEGLAEQAGLELQVAAGDLLLLGVRAPASPPLGQQLLHLVVADEVVLLRCRRPGPGRKVASAGPRAWSPSGWSPRSTGSRPTPGTARRAGGGRPRPRSPAARRRPAGTPRRPAPGARRAGPPAGSGSSPVRAVLAPALEGRAEDLRRSPRSGTTRRRRAGR